MWSNNDLNEIVIPPGATSGQREVINENGIFVYNADGSLGVAIVPANGTDPSGNAYFAGVNIYPHTGGSNIPDQIIFPSTIATQMASLRYVETLSAGVLTLTSALFSGGTNQSLVKLVANNIGFGVITIVQLSADQLQFIGNVSGFKFGNGLSGKYYYEEVSLAAQVIPSGVTTQLTGFTSRNLNSDYPSAFNLATGIWTAPETAEYDFNLFQAYIAWVPGSRGAIQFRVFGGAANIIAMQDNPVGNAQGGATLSTSIQLNAGTQVSFSTVQVCGANKTIDTVTHPSYISIGRRL